MGFYLLNKKNDDLSLSSQSILQLITNKLKEIDKQNEIKKFVVKSPLCIVRKITTKSYNCV